jgi:hypothetical protein
VKLGIFSDSHGNREVVRQAVRVLRAAGAEAFVHCGDVGGLEVLEELADSRSWFVWGNMDFVRPEWRIAVEALELPWPDGPLSLDVDGRRVGVFHGHERAFRQAMREACYDYLLHGHSHRRADYHVGSMRVVNPGALHRASVKTVALLDVREDRVDFLEVEG